RNVLLPSHAPWGVSTCPTDQLVGKEPKSNKGKDRTDTASRCRGADRARICLNVALSESRGRRECRMQAAPMARLQQGKQAAVTTGKAGTTGIPCAMGLRLTP